MDNKEKKNLPHDLFKIVSSEYSVRYSYFIANEDIVNDIVERLCSKPSLEEIDLLLQPLIDNFALIRMNAARFTKSSSRDIFQILFELYLSFDNGQSPPESIMTLFHILLYYGSNESNSFNWMFLAIASKMRTNSLTTAVLFNFIKMTKEIYKIRDQDNNSFQTEKNTKNLIATSSYFYFYPGSNSLKLDLKINKELDLNKGLGFSLWFKFPFLKHNLAIFDKENIGEIELVKIEFYNNQISPIAVKLGFTKDDTQNSILTLIGFNTTEQVYLSLNDILMHLYFVINIHSQHLELFINGSLMTKIKMNKFQMKQITYIELFKNFVGEVRCIVLYTNFSSKSSQSVNQLGKLNSFLEFYQELTDPENGKYPESIALAYLPYAKGENIYNYYENNSAYTLKFESKLLGVYNHCSSKDQVIRWFNANAYFPIFEYLYKHRHEQSFSLLNEAIIIQLLDIILECFQFVDDTNLNNKNENFFFILSMFLEKMPRSLFTMSFGKKMIDLLFEFTAIKGGGHHEKYITNILLNDKLMYKYHSSFIIWREIMASCIADETITSLCTMKELTKALLYFDRNRFTESCCSYHRDAFTLEKSTIDVDSKISVTIMEPTLNERIKEVIDLINDKIRYQSNRKEIITNEAIEGNDSRTEAQIMLSKLFYFNLSPCLLIRLLVVLRKCGTSDEVFSNCFMSFNTPLLDVKNVSLEFIISWIERNNLSGSSLINLGSIIETYFIPFCGAPVKYEKDIQLQKEYIDNSIKNTMAILIKWLLFTTPETYNSKISDKEAKEIANINENNNQLEDVEELKHILIELQGLLKKHYVFEPFFQELIETITEKITQLNKEEKKQLQRMIRDNIFQTKFLIIFGKLRDNSPFQLFYSKIVCLYYYLIANETSVIRMRKLLVTEISWLTSSLIENRDLYLEKEKDKIKERLSFNSAESNKMIQLNKEINNKDNIDVNGNVNVNANDNTNAKQLFIDILIEKTLFYLKKDNNITKYTPHHIDLLNMILISFNYYIITYRSVSNQREALYKHLNLKEVNSKSAEIFFDQVFDYYLCLWDKEIYRITNLLIEIIKSNKQKSSQNGLQFMNTLSDEQMIFTHTAGDPQHSYSLMMILGFIFIAKITKAKEENNVKLVHKFKDYLIFVIILSVVTIKISPKGKEVTQSRKNNSFFYEVIASGLELILSIEKESKGTPYQIQDLSSEVIYCIFYFYELYSKGNKNVFESLFENSHNVNLQKPVFIEIIAQMKEDKDNKDCYNDLLFRLKQNKGKIDPNNVQFPFLWKILLNSSVKERLKATRSILREFIQLGAAQSSFYSSDKELLSEAKRMNAKQEYLEKYQKEVRANLTQNYIDEKIKRKKYKQIKKEFCLWNRPWSNQELFYKDEETPIENFDELNFDHYPKSKMLNHYTKSFTRPFLVPIIDMTYHLPDFNKFKRRELFNKGDVNGSDEVCLNIDKVLDDEDNLIEQIANKENINLKEGKGEEASLNALYYSYNTSKEPDLYYTFEQSIKNDETSTKPSFETCELLNLKRKNICQSNICCLVKLSRHIKGKFMLHQITHLLEFKPLLPRAIYSNKEEEKNDIDFDCGRETCFGSYVKNYPKDNNKVYYYIQYNSITQIYQRKYFHRHTGLEIFTSNHKSYYFNFLSEKSRNDAFLILKSYIKDKANAFDYENKSNPHLSLWHSSKISTLHFLEMMNIHANRSYNDISQYPVFPWVYTNYTKETVPSDEKDYRDFSLPIGMMAFEKYPKSQERRESYIDSFQSMLDESLNNADSDDDEDEGPKENKPKKKKTKCDIMALPFYYGSHYSTPMYVTQFLVRLFPMGETLIELQGDKFDDPNRLFLSVESTFEGLVSLKGDVRELIPQFFYLPEFFLNINNFDLGITRNKQKVHNAQCPLWSQCSPFTFVMELRRFLEGDYVASNLHLWIDLIYGYKQQGEEAIKAHNLFMAVSYINQITIDEKLAKDKQEYIFRLGEFGLCPKQIFTLPCEAKQIKTEDNKSPSHIINLRKENSNHRFISIEYHSKSLIHLHLSMIKCISNNKLLFYYSNGHIEKIKYDSINRTIEVIKTKGHQQFGHKLLLANMPFNKNALNNQIGAHYESNQLPILVLDEGALIIQGGLYDGRLLLSTEKAIEIIKAPNEVYKSPISVLITNKEENVIIAGTQCGLIHIYSRSKKNPNQITLKRTMNNHQAEINHLFISHELNAFASAAKDNYVHIYATQTYKMIRSLRVNQCEQVLLSDSPLPSIVVYSSYSTRFLCYSLNGFLLKFIPEEEKPIDPRVIKDSMFFDYLIYATRKQTIYIRAFPYLDIKYSVSLMTDIDAFGSCLYDITQEMKSIVVYSVKGNNVHVIKDFELSEKNSKKTEKK